ncbi:hypothetical protein [Pareuzebyella sediminis]|uniref:hypothetical protein n=1 Tax=Pareuzebyella sediminis TaxID=2607998 RepID=UPI0011EEA478|nr:hypothetical protein [Pareuzebyella sediminis]
MNLWKLLQRYWIPISIILWAFFQMGLTKYSSLNPWKMGGYGMYSEYHPNLSYFVWIESEGQRTMARRSKLFTSNATFQKLILECRTYPSSDHLRKVYEFLRQNRSDSFKVEVWRFDFKADSRILKRVLVNSYEG